MKYFIFLLSLAINAGLIFVLGTDKILPVPLGSFLSVQEGVWQNAEPTDAGFDDQLVFENLQGATEVYFDERLVPHIYSENDSDAYFVQGYLHAKFRLWQMEFQTHAAAGRISEIVGSKAINFDRNQRRIGMVFAAENALAEMEKDPQTKLAVDAYTAGVNAYINQLSNSEFPIEYKLLGYKPEQWTNLKTALFTKQMTLNLAGYDRDFEFTNALKLLGEENFRILYSDIADSLYPVIQSGMKYPAPSVVAEAPPTVDSLYYRRKDTIHFTDEFRPDPSNGSNNWAVSGSRTKSGKPILANDPHLGLSLPSIWYEIQIQTPSYNAYGVSFPGIPGVVIGFNDSIAFGFTNSGRDVKDYYEIRFKDDAKDQYFFNNQWKETQKRIELIRVKNENTFLDTVAYTVFGPVTYDKSFKNELAADKAYALRWVAHDSSNILKMWFKLNRAKNYLDYEDAISHFNVPGQNMIFASRSGDIALWQQATFPLRWKDQGLFLMPGFDSSYMWKGYIPMQENPHVINPEQGYISSANQRSADTTYPYFIPGSYEVYRAITINRKLSQMQQVTADDMKALQNDNFNVFAEQARPILLQHVRKELLTPDENKYFGLVKEWNLMNDPAETGTVCFIAWWDSLQHAVFTDELSRGRTPLIKPEKFVLLEALLKDTSFAFLDNINTAERETLSQLVTASLKKAAVHLAELERSGKLKWSTYKNTTVYHLLKGNAMPFARSGLDIGGGSGIVNATQHDHGPSWKMIIEMTSPIQAHGVYPGGQSGNPGSKYYDNFIDTWTKGEYYTLNFFQGADAEKTKWKMSFTGTKK